VKDQVARAEARDRSPLESTPDTIVALNLCRICHQIGARGWNCGVCAEESSADSLAYMLLRCVRGFGSAWERMS